MTYFVASCFMKFSRQDRSPENFETEMIPHHERPPRSLNIKGKETMRSVSYKQKQEDMVVVKRLLRMFPMWAMFFVVSLISATGFTFFLQQYNNLNMSDKIPVQIYNIVQDLSRFVIPFLYRWICRCENEKIKIGVGMLCGIISCIFAWRLEVYRLKEVELLFDVEYTNTSISFLWLVPQFCVLGFMEGLTGEGLLKFYKSQMKEEPQLITYGEEYIEIVMGLGMLINIFLILVFDSQSGWFGGTINDSRLDKYYLVLVSVSLTNFIIYCLIARYCYKDQDLANDGQEQDNQVLVNDDRKQDDHVASAKSDHTKNNKLSASGNNKQGYQVMANDDYEQDNQVLDLLANERT